MKQDVRIVAGQLWEPKEIHICCRQVLDINGLAVRYRKAAGTRYVVRTIPMRAFRDWIVRRKARMAGMLNI